MMIDSGLGGQRTWGMKSCLNKHTDNFTIQSNGFCNGRAVITLYPNTNCITIGVVWVGSKSHRKRPIVLI